MSDRRLYRHYWRRRSQRDVAGIVASILLGASLIVVPSLISPTKMLPVGVGPSHHVRAPHGIHANAQTLANSVLRKLN
jgi:hypothetical protein